MGITALNHKTRAAEIAAFTHKGLSSTGWAGDVESAPTARTDRLAFFYGMHAGGTQIAKGAPACALRAQPRVALNKSPTMDAWLFIRSDTTSPPQDARTSHHSLL